MKKLFAISLLLMISLSVLAIITLPKHRSDVPVMFWVTDPNPARGPQILAFEKWMISQGYPEVELELDSNNGGTMKIIIQSASGVGGDIVDVYGGGMLRQLVSAGVLLDLTELSHEYGFDISKTYPAAEGEIFVDGRQYAFPCNITAWPLTINLAPLEREKLPLPKFDWTWDEFLQWALAVRKVDGNGNVTRFAVWPFNLTRFWATNGGTIFNETLTKCTLDSKEIREATTFYYDLMFKYKVMPTPVDVKAMASQGGYGGAMLQWLGNEFVLGAEIGRFGLIQLRKFDDFKPDVALLPYNVMPVQFLDCRSASINAGSSNKEVAARFLQFLTTDTYNHIIIKDLDALPPNPKIAQSPEFLSPVKNREGPVNRKYFIAVQKYGVSREYSKFVSPYVVNSIINKYRSGMASEILAVKHGLQGMTDEINREIKHTVERDPKLKVKYDKALARQAKIDALKAAGKPIPLDMVDNPVIRKLMEAGKWR